MKEKINLYLVVAPFQLLSAVENIDRSDGVQAWLMIRIFRTASNFEQIKTILDESDWDNIIYLNGDSNVLALFELIKFKMFLLWENISVMDVNIGEFYSGFCRWAVRIIAPKKLSILDDGVTTLDFFYPCENGIEGLRHHEELRSISPIFYRFSKRGAFTLKSFMTFPASPFWDTKKYDFQNFRKKAINHDSRLNENEVFLLGAKLVEDYYFDLGYYLELCQSVADMFPDKKIIYFPHRFETEEKLSILKDRLGFEVFRPNKPIEFYIAELEKRPAYVSSFTSAALFTIPVLFPDIQVWFIRSNPEMQLKPLGVDTRASPKMQRKQLCAVEVCSNYLEGMNNISMMDIQ